MKPLIALILLSGAAWGQVNGYSVPKTEVGPLIIAIGPGKVANIDGTVASYAGGSFTLSPNATTYGYVDTTGTPSTGTSVPAGDYPLFQAVTNTFHITSITDLRSQVFFSGVSAGANNVFTGTQTFGTADSSGPLLQFPTTNTNTTYGGAPWAFSTGTNTFSGTLDHLFSYGYNVGQGQSLVIAGKPMMGYQTEVDYNDGTNHWMEHHFDYTLDGITYYRPLTIGTFLTDGTRTDISLAIGTQASSSFNLVSGATQMWKMQPNGIWQCSLCTGSTNKQMFNWFNASGTDFMQSLGASSSLQISAGGNNVQYNFFPAANGFYNNAAAPLGSSSNPWGPTYINKLNQGASNKFAGTCAMAAGTTCTATLAASFTSQPVCIPAAQSTAASPPAAACLVGAGSTTVTITAASSNSLTWGYIVIGNPN